MSEPGTQIGDTDVIGGRVAPLGDIIRDGLDQLIRGNPASETEVDRLRKKCERLERFADGVIHILGDTDIHRWDKPTLIEQMYHVLKNPGLPMERALRTPTPDQ